MSGRPAASCPTSRCSSTWIPPRGSGGLAPGGATTSSARRSPSTGACAGATWRSCARSPSACGLCARPSPRPWSPRRYARSSRTSCVALDAIRDQPRAVALLRRALATDRVAHAYAFVGPTGAGRMTTALAFAQALLCTGGREAGAVGGWPETRRDPAPSGMAPSIPSGGREAGAVGGGPETRRDPAPSAGAFGGRSDAGVTRPRSAGAVAPGGSAAGVPPCGRCQGCRLAAGRVHPDLHLIAPTPPETNPKGARAIRIDAIRGLERQAALRPVMAPRKLFVLDEAERMTGEAPQAFLKTLEEPPAATVLILVLPRARALPATVIPRCQVVRFEPRSAEAAVVSRARARTLLAEVRAEGADLMFSRTERLDRETA